MRGWLRRAAPAPACAVLVLGLVTPGSAATGTSGGAGGEPADPEPLVQHESTDPAAQPTAPAAAGDEPAAPGPAAAAPPVAVADRAAVAAGYSVLVPVLVNDSDPDGEHPRLQSAGPAGSGTVAVEGDAVRYTAAIGSPARDTFPYTVADAAGGTAQGTVTVTVHQPTGHVLSGADVSPEPQVAGQPVTVAATAQTRYSDGALRPTPPGTPVDVLFRPARTSAYTVWSRTSVRTAGRAEAVVRPTRDGAWRVRIGSVQSAGDYLDVHTPTTTHRVGQTAAGPEPVDAGGTLTVRADVRTRYSDGRYRPTPVGTRFAVQFKPTGSTRYTSAGSGTVATAGVATTTRRPTRDGAWRVVVGSHAGGGDSVDVLIPASAGLDAVVSGPLTSSDVPYSYRKGCPVKPASLRRITLNYRDYAGKVQRGDLVVRSAEVSDLLYVFGRAWTAKFPIKRMNPTDYYYAGGTVSPSTSDKRAMNAGNTSAFNCRPVTGNPYRTSAHSSGVAIDINTWENPYVTRSAVYPAGARAYLKRTPYRTGMIVKGGPIATAMASRDWPWGARWRYPDYQHFSSTGA